MSFYSSQVGKKSSRYCNSSLYGSNLSSVYADGPPPLDDSTQDEDDDEMVFKSSNREKSLSRHETTDKESAKTTKDIDDSQPWPSSSHSASNNSSNDDFGDFSSFADFSSAFGGTKDNTTENPSTWFSANGDHSQSGGKSVNISNQEMKATSTYSDDDEFGCFSGGDDSDFENFKGFTEKPEMQADSKLENVSNGISNNLVTQQNDYSTQHVINQSNVLQTDLFSDDDDDEMNDFQSSNPGASTITNQSTHYSNYDEPMSPLSVDIPPILSDDNDDDDDDFGDFSSSNFSISNCNNSTTQNSIVNQKSTVTQINSGYESDSQQGTRIIDKNEDLSKPSSHLGQDNTVSDDSISYIQQSYSSNKEIDSDHQGSVNSTSTHESSNRAERSDDFGDFNTHFGTNDSDKSDEIGTSFTAFSHSGTQSSNCENNPSQTQENTNTSEQNENDFHDYRTILNSLNKEKTDNQKLASTNGNDVNNDDGDFCMVSEPQLYNSKQKNKNNAEKIEPNSPRSDSNDDDDFGNFRSTDVTDDTTSEKTVSNLQNDKDEFLNATSSDSSSLKESENAMQSFDQNEKSMFGNDISETGKGHKDDNDFGHLSNVAEPPQCNWDSDFDKCSISQSNSMKMTNLDDGYNDDDFGDFSSVQDVKSKSANSQLQDSNYGNFAIFPSSTGAKSGHDDEDDDFCDFNQPPLNKPKHDDDDFGKFDQVGNDNFGDLNQSASTPPKDDDDDFGEFGQPAKPGNSFGKSSSTKLKSDDDNDDFGDFEKPSLTKPEHNHDNDFGDFGNPSLTKAGYNNDGGFGDFSGSSSTNMGFADFKTSDDSDFSNTKSSDSFGSFSSGNQPSQSSVQSSFQPQSVTMATSKDYQSAETSKKVPSAFQPHKTPSTTVINHLIKQGFITVQSNVQDNVITVLLEHELNSGKSSVWRRIKGAERDGSLRFQWIDSDHKLKMLEALSMLPVRIQTSASFKSSGPIQTPLFASGLGLLEPTKGVITPFHHGVEEINPTQDPFGAPPEVGVPDLGFGGKGNGNKKDMLPGHLDVKDSSDTISVSSSLDLDFLAPASSSGDLSKPEGKALFEDDLLGLGMHFSASNESPTVLNSSKDQKNIFKFNTSAVSTPSDDKNLSESARKIVNDFEDLSFMLSRVLMFPLKSDK